MTSKQPIANKQRIRIGNRRFGGLWWRIPSALGIWLLWAAPQVIALIGLMVLRSYAVDLPRTPNLDRWEAELPRTSRILAADGTVLAELPFHHRDEIGHRYFVRFEEIPAPMVQAILAAEDVRFFEHRGVDLQAVARAAWTNYRANKIVEGASTITQQVARNLLPQRIGKERSLRRKVREALLARRIERRYGKAHIFEVYVNHVFLGASAYGIRAASRAYFDKPLDALSLAQAAMIAGLIQAPGRADPFKNPRAARARRNEVLTRMRRAGFIDEPARRAAANTALELSPPPVRYGTVAPWHTEWVRKYLEETAPALYDRGGLIVETSAQPLLSLAAEEAASEHVARLGRGRKQGAPQVGALVWDHRTGYVEATVGGRSWTASKFDRSTQACRQPGSAWKPLLYGAAIEAGVITPGTPLRDAPVAEYDDRTGVHWKPTNSGRDFQGVALAQDALARSLNAPAVDVLDRVGSAPVIAFARRLGLTTKVADVRPMALGASCVVPLELAGAFAVFASGGMRVEPVFVTRVRRGAEVFSDRAAAVDPWIDPARRFDRIAAQVAAPADRVLDAQSAFLISNMLRDVVRRGTGRDARNIGRPAAGKTGTTNDNTDAWFVGYTARVVSAVWVGHDDPARTMGRRDGGSHAALPLWKQLVRAAEKERTPAPVLPHRPKSLVRASIDPETGLLSAPGSGGAAVLWFKPGTAPTERVGTVQGVPTDMGRLGREF